MSSFSNDPRVRHLKRAQARYGATDGVITRQGKDGQTVYSIGLQANQHTPQTGVDSRGLMLELKAQQAARGVG